MASPRIDIVSIGTLSRNLLWNEPAAVRTPHATCSLVRTGKRTILVDPGLPPQALAARLFERTGLRPEQIDEVFLTNFRPAHRAGLPLFDGVPVWCHENEIEPVREHLNRLLISLNDDDDDAGRVKLELDLLDRLRVADDQLAPGIDLFPLFGYTPGNCGLLVNTPTQTILIAGDAVATQDHFLAGQVLPDLWNLAQARESLEEVYEIADVIVPGHDNLFLNPRASGM